eukprot:4536296-Prymnesium_polylepis.1
MLSARRSSSPWLAARMIIPVRCFTCGKVSTAAQHVPGEKKLSWRGDSDSGCAASGRIDPLADPPAMAGDRQQVRQVPGAAAIRLHGGRCA